MDAHDPLQMTLKRLQCLAVWVVGRFSNERLLMCAGDFLELKRVSTPADQKQKRHPIGCRFMYGGAGGNRTPVRKPATDSSTYLAWLFVLILHPPTDKRLQDELPWI